VNVGTDGDAVVELQEIAAEQREIINSGNLLRHYTFPAYFPMGQSKNTVFFR